MALVNVPGKNTIEVADGSKLFPFKGAIPVASACDGVGCCKSCAVRATVIDGEGKLSQPTEKEVNGLGDKLKDNIRLLCQTRILEGEVTLEHKNSRSVFSDLRMPDRPSDEVAVT